MTIPQFQKIILSWYKKNKRDLPWRKTRDPYKILVSEIMLQQTQISRVIPKYKEFLKAFPALQSLAKASTKKLFKVWQGMGYWRRALYLRETAKKIVEEFKGKFPSDPDVLETFPGIGRYTARAIACFAFGASDAFIETNIRRVYLHFFFSPSSSSSLRNQGSISDEQILEVAQKAIYKKNPREWGWALMDYGSIVLKDKAINKQSRHYHKQSKFKGSFRSFRTKMIQYILKNQRNRISIESAESFLLQELRKQESEYAASAILASLVSDGLIKKSKDFYSI